MYLEGILCRLDKGNNLQKGINVSLLQRIDIDIQKVLHVNNLSNIQSTEKAYESLNILWNAPMSKQVCYRMSLQGNKNSME